MSLQEYKLKSLKDKHAEGLVVTEKNIDKVIKTVKKALEKEGKVKKEVKAKKKK